MHAMKGRSSLENATPSTTHCQPTRLYHGLLHYLHFAWKLVKASVEAFTASMEASTEYMEAMEASMEASMEAMEAVEASMEDMEDMKASTEVTSTGASTKAFTKASMEVTSTKAPM